MIDPVDLLRRELGTTKILRSEAQKAPKSAASRVTSSKKWFFNYIFHTLIITLCYCNGWFCLLCSKMICIFIIYLIYTLGLRFLFLFSFNVGWLCLDFDLRAYWLLLVREVYAMFIMKYL